MTFGRFTRFLSSLFAAVLLVGCYRARPAAVGPAAALGHATVTDGVVDLGSIALHIHCAGHGQPLVVLEAGLGNDGTIWREVQLEVSRSTRACAYDRAGLGYSSPPSFKPHSNRQMARELHELLLRSGQAGPYVMVGHSMGGLNVRLFEAEHRDEVAGMVLVDASVDPTTMWSLVPEAELKMFRAMMAKLGEGIDADTFAAGAAEARAVSKSLGAKPLVVLTRSVEQPQPWASPEQVTNTLQVWQSLQTELPKLSSNAVHVVAAHSSHYVQVDAPKLVIAAIEEVVRAARTKSRLNESVLTTFNRSDR